MEGLTIDQLRWLHGQLDRQRQVIQAILEKLERWDYPTDHPLVVHMERARAALADAQQAAGSMVVMTRYPGSREIASGRTQGRG